MDAREAHIIPKTGLAGLKQNWQSDLMAAISVSLVALPLSLGIAIASGVPPMAGVISAIIGGIVTTFFRGSHVAINGPTAGLIAAILSSAVLLHDENGNTLNYVFAAIVVSGGLQICLGLFRLGRYADIFHSTVIHGILAAIGVIIFANQIHVALGTVPSSNEVITLLVEAVQKLPDANPFVVIISIAGLILLFFQSKINYKLFHFIPAPMWVLALSMPFVYLFNFFEPHTIDFIGRSYSVGPELLVTLPDNLLDSFSHPDFSRADTGPFWMSVLMITMIASIESLSSSKAVDKLDPYKRKTDLNKDLVGIGISTMVSGFLGGLPIISVIVRSTVNVNNHAKTKWSNFFHGLLILMFIFVLAPFIQKVPLAALAAILVFTGYKLASPKVFREVYSQGIEQLIIFTGTLIITLYTDLLIGIFGGLLLALVIHFLLAKLPISDFFKAIYNPGSTLIMHKDESFELRLKGVANFLSTLKTEALLDEVPAKTHLTIDLSETRLVDFSTMEKIYDFIRVHELNGGEVEIIGLDDHISSSPDKMAMRVQIERYRKATPRQLSLMEMSIDHGWKIELKASDQVKMFGDFYFFHTRPVTKRFNHITSSKNGLSWELCDLNFEEGALLATEKYKSTVGHLPIPGGVPRFTIEKKNLLDRYMLAHKDIDYSIYDDFSDDFIVKVENLEEMKVFMTQEMRNLIERSSIHHLESDGKGILVFSRGLKLAQLKEYSEMVHFLDELRELVSEG